MARTKKPSGLRFTDEQREELDKLNEIFQKKGIYKYNSRNAAIYEAVRQAVKKYLPGKKKGKL